MKILTKPLSRYNQPFLEDWAEGGRKLAEKLKKMDLKKPVVLAIPRGGAPVGAEIARALKAPFDFLIVKKISFPWSVETGFGAIAANGDYYLSPHALGLTPRMIEKQKEKALEKAQEREKTFLEGRKRIVLKDKTVILTDDGIATGSTILAAAKIVQKQKPAKLIVAVPTASEEGTELLRKEGFQVISLYEHPKEFPFALANSYEKWHDLTDAEVKEYLGQA